MAIPEKSKQRRGLRTWNFQRYWRKNIWKFQGSFKKEVEFSRMYKKKSYNFRGSWFLNLKFTRGVTKFCRISRAESLFSLEYLGIKWQTKNSKGVFRKVYLQPPCSDFSWNSPTLTILFEILTIDDMPVDASYMLWFLLKYWEIVEIGPKNWFFG